jgi:hypothetical protein
MTPYYKGERLNLDCNQFAPKAHCATLRIDNVPHQVGRASAGQDF